MFKGKKYYKKKYKKKYKKRNMLKSAGTAGVEYKNLDSAANVVVNAAGSITSQTLVAIPEGTGESERVGRQVQCTSLNIRGYIKIETFNYVPASFFLRFIVYVDKQANGAAATPAELIDTNPAGFYINNLRNLEQTDRFIILKDKLIRTDPTSGLYNTNLFTNVPTEQFVPFKCNLSLNDMPIQYSGTAGGLSDIRSNNIGIMCISSDPASNGLRVRYTARVRYKDN